MSRRGQISLENAARLARAARKTSPGAVQHDPGLIGLAKTLPADEFAHAARRWEAQHQDAADLAAQHRRNRRNRHVRFWNGEDGSVQMRGSFDAETGARIQQRLRRQAEQHRRADRRRAQHPNRAAGGDNNDNDNGNGNDNDSNGSGGGGAAGPATEQRTTDQRMADALDTLLAAGTAAQSTGTTAQSAGTTAQSAGTTAQQGVRTPPAQTARLAAGQVPPPGTPQGVRTPSAPAGPADQRPDTNLPPQPDLLRPPDTDSPRPGRHGHAEGIDQSEPALSAVPPAVGRKAAAEIIVRADLAALTDQPGGFAEICGVGPIPPGALARLACNSDVWVEIFGDTLTPLYETVAQRAATAAQRRALIARDGSCIGCGALPLECEAHHVIPWKSGGKTHVDNLVLVCWSCHDRIHDHNWHVVLRDGRYRLMPPDPAQPPNPARSRKPKHRTPHQPAPADTSQPAATAPSRAARCDHRHTAQTTGTDRRHTAQTTGTDRRHTAQTTGTDRRHTAQTTGTDRRHTAQTTGTDRRHTAQTTGTDRRHTAQTTGTDRRHTAQTTGTDRRHTTQITDRHYATRDTASSLNTVCRVRRLAAATAPHPRQVHTRLIWSISG